MDERKTTIKEDIAVMKEILERIEPLIIKHETAYNGIKGFVLISSSVGGIILFITKILPLVTGG